MTARNKLAAQADACHDTTAAEKINSAAFAALQDQRSTPGLHNLEELFKIIFDNSPSDPEERRKS